MLDVNNDIVLTFVEDLSTTETIELAARRPVKEDDEDDVGEEHEDPTANGSGPQFTRESAITKTQAEILSVPYFDFVHQHVIPFGDKGTPKSWSGLTRNKGRNVFTAALWFLDFVKWGTPLAFNTLEHRKNVSSSKPGEPIRKVYSLTEESRKTIIGWYHSRYVKNAPAEHPQFTGHAVVVTMVLQRILQQVQQRAGVLPRRTHKGKPLKIPFVDHLSHEEAIQFLKDAEADKQFRKLYHLMAASPARRVLLTEADLKAIVNFTGQRDGKFKMADPAEIEEAPAAAPAKDPHGMLPPAASPTTPVSKAFTVTAPSNKPGQGPVEISKRKTEVLNYLTILFAAIDEANANQVFNGSTGEAFVTKMLAALKGSKISGVTDPKIPPPFVANDERVVAWIESIMDKKPDYTHKVGNILSLLAKQVKTIDVFTKMAVDANNGATDGPEELHAIYNARLSAIQGLFQKWLKDSSAALSKPLDTKIRKMMKDFNQAPVVEDEKPKKAVKKAPAKKAAGKAASKAADKKPAAKKAAAKKSASKAPAKKAAKKAAAKKPAAKKPAAKKATKKPAAKKPASKAAKKPAAKRKR